jgi:hypothetical protein
MFAGHSVLCPYEESRDRRNECKNKTPAFRRLRRKAGATKYPRNRSDTLGNGRRGFLLLK